MSSREIEIINRVNFAETGIDWLPLERSDRRINAQLIQIFKLIINNPGVSMQTLAEGVGLNLSSVSRNLMCLGERHRDGRLGLGWVVTIADPAERRRKIAFATEVGQQLVSALLSERYRRPIVLKTISPDEYVDTYWKNHGRKR